MKSCPTCKKTFTDQNLSYCVDDGTPLVSVDDYDDELTEVGVGNRRIPPPYQPPSYGSPAGEKRRTWPLVVGIFGVLALILVGVSVAAVIFVPRLLKNSNTGVVTSNNNSNTASNQNSDSANANTTEPNSNANSTAELNTPAPTDKELVLAQLKDLEQEWTVANINADKKKLGEILADDYVSPRADGKMQGKEEYIRTIERDTSIQKWEFRDLKVTLRGDRATLFGKVSFQLRDREQLYDFIDRFVWREGRWQATGSEVTPTQ
jgi:hypothetical protein